jgi:D-alanyl-D-alanine carboxypeptidase/D-alanyl-D-alanine-endopeptidase (penicillin-binding protein 4)
MKTIAWVACCGFAMTIGPVASAQTAQPATLPEVVRQVMSRSEFHHATFGVEVYSLDTGKPVFALNADQMFLAASTTKLLTEGTALKLLGPDYRFHTPVYRTGDIGPDGVLAGDLVLVASGDPNLSGRARPDGGLAFENEDHSYGGPDARVVPGDPLAAMRDLARQIAAAGIKRVTGRVLVDVSLFPQGAKELGTGVVISPIAVNDNVIDVTLKPGDAIGDPLKITVSPQLPFVHFVNETRTVAGSELEPEEPRVTTAPDGHVTVVLSGSMGHSVEQAVFGYPVPSPSLFAAATLTLALKDVGIAVDGAPGDLTAPRKYEPRDMVAEHVSPRLAEEVKVTLKVSQNLHASMTPFIVGAIVGKATKDIDHEGFTLEHDMLAKAGLDLSGASQADGAGGSGVALYSPDFMARYLAYMASQPEFPAFEAALPILGRDGTLADIQPASPGAGHVFAKTGTFDGDDLLNGKSMLTAKGLAGYTTTPSGRRYAFALYVNHVELGDDRNPSKVAGQALGEIASAIYALPVDEIR